MSEKVMMEITVRFSGAGLAIGSAELTWANFEAGGFNLEGLLPGSIVEVKFGSSRGCRAMFPERTILELQKEVSRLKAQLLELANV